MNHGRIEEIGSAESIYNLLGKTNSCQLIKRSPDTKLECDIQSKTIKSCYGGSERSGEVEAMHVGRQIDVQLRYGYFSNNVKSACGSTPSLLGHQLRHSWKRRFSSHPISTAANPTIAILSAKFEITQVKLEVTRTLSWFTILSWAPTHSTLSYLNGNSQETIL